MYRLELQHVNGAMSISKHKTYRAALVKRSRIGGGFIYFEHAEHGDSILYYVWYDGADQNVVATSHYGANIRHVATFKRRSDYMKVFRERHA